MDQVYIIRNHSHVAYGWYPKIERENGEEVKGAEFDRIVESLQQWRSAYVYLAYGYSRKIGKKCHKIGFSIKPRERLNGLGLEWLTWIPCDYNSRHRHEKQLQGYYTEQGKWLGGEWFELTEEDVAFIKSLESWWDIEHKCPTWLCWGSHDRMFQTDVRYLKDNYEFGKQYNGKPRPVDPMILKRWRPFMSKSSEEAKEKSIP